MTGFSVLKCCSGYFTQVDTQAFLKWRSETRSGWSSVSPSSLQQPVKWLFGEPQLEGKAVALKFQKQLSMFNVGKSLFSKKNVDDSLRPIKMSWSCPCLLLARRGALAFLLLWCSLCGRKQALGAGKGEKIESTLSSEWLETAREECPQSGCCPPMQRAHEMWQDHERPGPTDIPATRALCPVSRMRCTRLSNVTAYFLDKTFFQNLFLSWPLSLKLAMLLHDKAYVSYFNKELECCKISTQVSSVRGKNTFFRPIVDASAPHR